MTSHTSAPRVDRRAQILLGVGAVIGILLAAAGALTPTDRNTGGLPKGAVARINGRTISAEEYARALKLLAGDKRNAMTDADRAHVLNRLIEEELLIQRGVEIGLVDSDRTVRKSISAAMIQSIVAESASEQPSEAELRAFYQKNQAFFVPPAPLRIRQIVFRKGTGADDPHVRAAQASEAVRNGMSFAEAAAAFGDTPILLIPDTLLPPHKLREYIGPTLLRTTMAMQIGDVSPPLHSPSGYCILQLLDRAPGRTVRFEDIREQVKAAYSRHAGDKALREYLDWLRDEADVILSPEAPQ